jgi:hypothetical protein
MQCRCTLCRYSRSCGHSRHSNTSISRYDEPIIHYSSRLYLIPSRHLGHFHQLLRQFKIGIGLLQFFVNGEGESPPMIDENAGTGKRACVNSPDAKKSRLFTNSTINNLRDLIHLKQRVTSVPILLFE